VPKEEVYPRFNALGAAWVKLFGALLLLRGRRAVAEGLMTAFRNSFNSTLPDALSPLTQTLAPSELGALETELASRPIIAEAEDPLPTSSTADEVSAAAASSPTALDVSASSSEAVVLSVATAEDFLGLCLELQGYCPWTLTHGRGLLVPGQPLLGVVQFRGQFFVCEHEAGLRAFVSAPERYLEAVRALCCRSPEYIHLLRVQSWFPRGLRLLAAASEQEDQDEDQQHAQDTYGNASGRASSSTREVGCETPVHFDEGGGHIVVDYHWNEWELRRRALSLLTLQVSYCIVNQPPPSSCIINILLY
jgi:hypothetical protein